MEILQICDDKERQYHSYHFIFVLLWIYPAVNLTILVTGDDDIDLF